MRTLTSPVDTSAQYHSRRLLRALDVIHDGPITFIHAPMGFGKTVAVRHYLEQRKSRPLWVSILTRDPDAFWRDFCNTLRRGLPGKTDVPDSLERLGYPSDPAKVDAAREVLARLKFPPGTVLVFDDVHLLPESQTSGLVRLCLLLVRQGAFPPIVFISRHSPVQELAEPLLKGIVTAIEPAVFAFDAEEIGQYFERCGISLEESEAENLLKATGGWISALYLYLLHYVRHGQLAAPMELSALLESQVFDRLRDAKYLLLALSPLESFSLPQAELFCEDARAVLAEALRRNAFLRHDPVTGTYTLHALFRDFLLQRFGELPLQRQQDACMRNADWLIRHDKIRAGVELLGRFRDSEEALGLLDSVVDRLPVTEGNGRLLALFRAFRPSLMDRFPGVMFRYAMASLSAGDMPAFSDVLERLGRHCASLPPDDPAANGWRGEMELLRALTRYNDIQAMSVHHRRAAEYFRLSETGKSRLFGQDPWTLGSPSVLYMFHRESGRLEATMAAMRECLPLYSGLTGMHGAGAEDAVLAEARFQAGEFKSAAVACHKALSSAREHGQIGIEVCARFLLARLDVMDGDYGRAVDQMETMRRRVEEEKAFSLLRTLDLCNGFLHVQIHRPEMIPAWLLSGGEERLYAFAGGCSYLVLGGALLFAGEYAELVGRFSLRLQQGTFAKNLLFTILAHLFVAAGNVGLGLWAKADDALFAALDLALPDRIYMPFVINAVFLPQLKGLKDHETYGYDIGRILQLSTSFEKVRNGIVSRFFPEDTRPLTPRERELVRLALTGMTYKEIAEAAGLAPNSVKRYFAALYKKLGISNREQLKHYFTEGEGRDA